MHTTHCTTAELAAQITPYIERKFNRGPRIAAIDILGVGEHFDADIRGVNAEGVKIYWINACFIEPWEKIRGIRLAALDDEGTRVFVREYRHEVDVLARAA